MSLAGISIALPPFLASAATVCCANAASASVTANAAAMLFFI